jgi:hypothetical protein
MPTVHNPLAPTRVVKRLSPLQPGAIKLARRYGRALVCVRYRHDAAGRMRYTTVELVVDEAPLDDSARRARSAAAAAARAKRIVAVVLDPNDLSLRKAAMSHGAAWNARDRVWYMPHAVAKALKILDRIV